MEGYVVRKRTRLGDTEAEVEAATDRRVTENHYPSDDNPYDSLYPVDDRGKTKELDPESQEVSAKEMFDSTVSILFQAMRMEGSTVPGSQFSTTGVRFDEGRNLGDIAGRPDGKAYKNVPNKPDRGGLGSSFPTKVDGNEIDADTLGYAGLTTENTYSETTGPPQVMAFPWLPFFSNCRGFDSQIAYSKLLETHEDCRLSKHEDTRFIYDFDPLEQLLTKGMWESDAIADVCVHDKTTKTMKALSQREK
jgi:hypothetical protein